METVQRQYYGLACRYSAMSDFNFTRVENIVRVKHLLAEAQNRGNFKSSAPNTWKLEP